MNTLLQEGEYSLHVNDEAGPRKATIVYSGGDDVFIIGAWDDIIGFAVDLNDSLSDYAQGTLTISAGIGIYPEKYPVAAMARQTGELEDASKAYPGKNAVTLFDESGTYSWDEFINAVLAEKYELIRDFFQTMQDYGKSFLYRLLDLMRSRDEKSIWHAMLICWQGWNREKRRRMKAKKLYQEFSQKMYQWMLDEKACKQAITALYIYVYTIRETAEGE